MTSRPLISALSVVDPYASRPNHAGNLRDVDGSASHHTPDCHDQMRFGAGTEVDLTPGVYYVTNGNFPPLRTRQSHARPVMAYKASQSS